MSLKVTAIIKREYLSRARTKGFIIGTLLFPLILVLLFGGIFIIGSLFKPTTRTYAILDASGVIYEKFINMQADTLKNGEPEYIFIKKTAGASGTEAVLEDLKQQVRSEELDGYLYIPANIVEDREAVYSARNVSDFEEQGDFRGTLSYIVTNLRLEKRGFPVDEIRREMSRGYVRLKSTQVTDTGEVEKSGISSYLLAYVLTYVMLLMIMIYGQTLMRSVIEEKSQRITETIVSSVSPVELMLGKLVGVCALGLTQLVIFGGFVLAAVTYAGPLFKRYDLAATEFMEILGQLQFSGSVFAFMIVFFLLGFVFFSTMFAAVGAMVNSEDEGQQYQMPLIFLIMIGYFIMFTVAKNPETTRAFWVALFPLFTPLVQFARVAVSDPIIPSGTYLSIFTMIIFTALLIMAVSKIYRVGILMYGKKPSIKETLKWLRYK